MQYGMTDEKRKKLGVFLNKKRSLLGMSVRDVEQKTGIPFSSYAAIERGEKSKITMDMIESLSVLYGVKNDTLCFMAERIPRDAFYKIIRCPELLEVIRFYKGAR